MKVLVTDHDPFMYVVRGEAEAVQLFGEEYFKECAVDLPEDVVKKYNTAHQAFIEAQEELSKELKQAYDQEKRS